MQSTSQNQFAFQPNAPPGYNNKNNKRRTNIKLSHQPIDIVSVNSAANYNSNTTSQ